MKRPMCWLCLLFIAAVWLGDLTGLVPVRETAAAQSLPGEGFIGEKGQAVVYGRIYQYHYSENSTGICLTDVYLKSQLRSQVGDISKKLSGRVIIYMQEGSEDVSQPLGTWVRVRGKLQEIEGPRNPGEFDSRLYYQTKKIYYRMSGYELTDCGGEVWHLREGLRQFRGRLADSLEKAVPEQAGILCAMVVGEKSLLAQEDKNLLAAGSLSHMISISGMHLSLLGMLCFYLCQRLRLGIGPAAMVSVGLMLFYGMLAGEGVATMRALGMFGLAMIARAIRRSYDLLSALALSVIILLLDNPAYLFYSGFLLSCGCICAVGVVLPQIREIFSFEKAQRKREKKIIQRKIIQKKIIQTLEMGAAVQMTTLPLTTWFYYEIPIYGILVNLLVVPTLAVTLVSGWAGAAVGIWSVSAARVFLIPGCALIRFYQGLCGLVKGLPGAMLTVGQPGIWQVLAYYGLLAAGFLLGRRTGRRAVGVSLCLLCVSAGVMLLCSRFQGSLEVTCLDVGQGDGAVACTLQGKCFMVDGGSSSQKKIGQYTILPFLKSQGISRVDAVFVSHTDADHINGIEEILDLIRTGQTSLKIRHLVLPGLEKADEGQERLAALAAQAGVAVRYLNAGGKVEAYGVCWQALSPLVRGQTDDINEDSLVLLLEAGGFRGLFTGDIGEEQEERLSGHLMDCDFLKVAHHGSRYSTGERFLREVCPKIGVASASATNTYGHPHPDTLGRLEKNRCRVFLTKDSGAVTLKVGEDAVRVRTYLH